MPLNTTLSKILLQDDRNANEIDKYLEQDSARVNKADQDGEMLMFYIQNNQSCRLDVIKLLLKYGANINFREPVTNCTPLIAALETTRDAAVIKVLLENGADVLSEISYLEGSRAILCIAHHFGASKDVVKLLLDAGCPLNGCQSHDTALHCAIGDLYCPGDELKEEVLELLIERGADVNAIDSNNTTVMCHALRMGYPSSLIKMLLKAGSSVKGCVEHPSAFFCAIYSPITLNTISANVAKLLLDNQVSMHDLDINGNLPLQFLLRFRDYEVDTVKLFLHHLTDVDVVDKNNNNLLHLVLMNHFGYNCLGVVELLLKRGVRIDTANSDGDQPLHIAAINRSCGPDVLKLLLKNGADLNAENISGDTPLKKAIFFVEIIPKINILFAAGSLVGNRNLFMFRRSPNDPYLCEPYKVKCFRILTMYYLLEVSFHRTSFFDIPYFEDSIPFSEFVKGCAEELTKMDSVFVGQGCTLREFLLKYSPYQKYSICDKAIENYDWNQLLRIKAGNAFPMYSHIIWEKVDRPFMEAKLQELRVYTYANKACGGEKIVLNYNVVCKIVEELSDDCLFSLITAFSNMDDRASSIPVGIKEKCGEKRNIDESTECRKRVKVMSTKSALP